MRDHQDFSSTAEGKTPSAGNSTRGTPTGEPGPDVTNLAEMTLVDSPAKAGSRERVLETAYRLVGRHGLAETTLERVAQEAGVAVADVEVHFPTPRDLVIAAMEHRGRSWSQRLEEEITRRATDPADQILALFDVYEDLVIKEHLNVPELFTVMAEAGQFTDGGAAPAAERVRERIAILATEAGVRDAEDFAMSIHVLMRGTIVAALEGDTPMLGRAKKLATALLQIYRPVAAPAAPRLRLQEAADQSEWVVVSEHSGQAAMEHVAVIREERSGFCGYPNVVGYGRLGPFDTIEEAYGAVVARVSPSGAPVEAASLPSGVL